MKNKKKCYLKNSLFTVFTSCLLKKKKTWAVCMCVYLELIMQAIPSYSVIVIVNRIAQFISYPSWQLQFFCKQQMNLTFSMKYNAKYLSIFSSFFLLFLFSYRCVSLHLFMLNIFLSSLNCATQFIWRSMFRWYKDKYKVDEIKKK